MSFIITTKGCPYCMRALEILDKQAMDYKQMDRQDCPELVEQVKSTFRHKTFPMIFLFGQFVGGCSELECFRFDRRPL